MRQVLAMEQFAPYIGGRIFLTDGRNGSFAATLREVKLPMDSLVLGSPPEQVLELYHEGVTFAENLIPNPFRFPSRTLNVTAEGQQFFAEYDGGGTITLNQPGN